MSIIINNIDDSKFSINGLQFSKIFSALKVGDNSLKILCVYDSKLEILPVTKFDAITVDGNTFNDLDSLFNDLQSKVYNNQLFIEISDKLNKGGFSGTAQDLQDAIDLIAESESLISVNSEAAMTAKWTELNAAGKTPVDGRELFRTDLNQYWKWNSTLTEKGEFSRNNIETSDGSDTLEYSTKYFDGAKIFTKIQSEITDAIVQSVTDEEINRLNADTTLQGNIDTQKARIDAILNMADVDKDTFVELVALINQIDTENDSAFANYVLSNSKVLEKKANLEVVKNLFNKNVSEITLVSGNSATTDNYGDVIIKDAAATGFNLGTWGIAYNEYNLSVSHKIPLSETNNKAKSNQNVSTSTQVLYFDINGICIGVSTSEVQATWFANVEYARFTFPSANKNNLQIEYGEVSTAYEAYALRIKESELPTPTGAVASGNKKSVSGENILAYINAQGFVLPSDLNNKADLEIDTINLFNKDATKVPAVDNDSPYDTDVFADDAIIEHGWSTGFNFGTWKIIYQSGSSLSPKIFLTETGDKNTIVTNVPSNVYQRIFYFNSLGQIINIATNTTSATWIANTSYVRVMFQPSFADSLMINYGTELQTYSAYDSNFYLKKTQVPKELDIEAKLLARFGSVPNLALPNKMYFLKDNNTLIYLKGVVNNEIFKTDLNVVLSDRTVTKKFEDLIIIDSSVATTVNQTVSLIAINSLLESKNIAFKIVEAPLTLKSLEGWNSGDSITDLGNYQPEIKRLLALNNIDVTFTGLMPNADVTIFADPLSGGDLGFIAEKGTDAMVVDVTGVVVPPVTGYPGTQYEDTNGNVWVCRGYKLTESGGTYSGKIKLGIFQADPNYDVGGSSGTTPTGGFPSNSTLTKTNALAGDAIINYTTVDVVNFNPYWNPNTDEVDFEWYRTYWGFNVPDFILLQFSYNDVGGSYEEIDGEKIILAMTRAKIVVDKFLSQFPNAKVVFGTDPYGSELPTYAGTTPPNNIKRYNTINFFKGLCNTFENATYDGKVYLVPVHAQFDHLTGYGAKEVTNIDVVNVDGVDYTFDRLKNGFDGVHPNDLTEGWKYEANAYLPVFVEIANNL